MKPKEVVVKKHIKFIDGPIDPLAISKTVKDHQAKKDIGGHAIFLGQVRADEMDGKTVTGIEYTSYEEMADKVMCEIKEEAFAKFDIKCMHVSHSLGLVPAGEICLLVFVSSAHRDAAYVASRYVVEEIKTRMPIFGKEILADDSYVWKKNK